MKMQSITKELYNSGFRFLWQTIPAFATGIFFFPSTPLIVSLVAVSLFFALTTPKINEVINRTTKNTKEIIREIGSYLFLLLGFAALILSGLSIAIIVMQQGWSSLPLVLMFKGASFSSAAITSMLVGTFFFAQNFTFQWHRLARLKDLWEILPLMWKVPNALISVKKKQIGIKEYFKIIDYSVYFSMSQIITSVIMTGLTFVALILLPSLPTALANANLKFLPGMTPLVLIASAIGGLLAYLGTIVVPRKIKNISIYYLRTRIIETRWQEICSEDPKLLQQAADTDTSVWSLDVLNYASTCFATLTKEVTLHNEVDDITFFGKSDAEIEVQIIQPPVANRSPATPAPAPVPASAPVPVPVPAPASTPADHEASKSSTQSQDSSGKEELLDGYPTIT
jgi:hypothetical protein